MTYLRMSIAVLAAGLMIGCGYWLGMTNADLRWEAKGRSRELPEGMSAYVYIYPDPDAVWNQKHFEKAIEIVGAASNGRVELSPGTYQFSGGMDVLANKNQTLHIEGGGDWASGVEEKP